MAVQDDFEKIFVTLKQALKQQVVKVRAWISSSLNFVSGNANSEIDATLVCRLKFNCPA